MISRFFIDRPIFATVLSVVITLIGWIALMNLPVAQYPRITPPGVSISISYPGASAQVVADAVAAPIEQAVNGVENMLYMSSQMGNDGTYTLTVTFDLHTDIKTALVMVQNRVTLAEPLLPIEVQNQGITIRKRTPDLLMIINFISPDGRYDDIYLSNYCTIFVRDEILRVEGVSDTFYQGQRDYSIRAWLDPQKLAALNMTPMDVAKAIQDQNRDVPAGQLGQPPVSSELSFQLPIGALGELSKPEQFEDIIIKAAIGRAPRPTAPTTPGRNSGVRPLTQPTTITTTQPGGMIVDATSGDTGTTASSAATPMDKTTPTPVTSPSSTVAMPTPDSPATTSTTGGAMASGGGSTGGAGTSGGGGSAVGGATGTSSTNGANGLTVTTGASGAGVLSASLGQGPGRPSAAIVRLKDVGRVEMGAQNYNLNCIFDGKPSVGLGIYQLPGTNAIDVADAIYAKMEELKTRFPEGVDYSIAYDTTLYIRDSVADVEWTLIEAVVLVGMVVLVFLQDWKAMILPMIDVPVSIIGTFAVMAVMGYSLNNISLFGLVLAIGIVVDDAIVVLENIERLLATGLDVRSATIKAMDEVTGPIIAVALVLCAVFIPCALIGGITGQFFRQFAVTISVSMVISAINAVTMTPSRAVLVFKTEESADGHAHIKEALPWWFFALVGGGLAVWLGNEHLRRLLGLPNLFSENRWNGTRTWYFEVMAIYLVPGVLVGGLIGWMIIRPVNWILGGLFRAFNRAFDLAIAVYGWIVGVGLKLSPGVLVGYAVLLVLTLVVFQQAPKGFIPQQDQGRCIISIQLPDSASLQRCAAVVKQIDDTSRFRLTVNRRAVAAMKADNVPDDVVERVHSLGRREFKTKRSFQSALAKVLTHEELEAHREQITKASTFGIEGVNHTVGMAGSSFVLQANGPNFASMFVVLDTFDKRQKPHLSDVAIMATMRRVWAKTVRDAQVVVYGSSPVPGLGVAGGFKLMVEDRSGLGPGNLQKHTDEIVRKMKELPELVGVGGETNAATLSRVASTQFRANTPQLYFEVDRDKATALGVQVGDVNSTLQMYLGSLYVNSFNEFGRHWQVTIQAEGTYRDQVKDINLFKVRNNMGQMVPLGTLINVKEIGGPIAITRYNLSMAASITGNIRSGLSTGEAIDAIDRLAQQSLPLTMKAEWTELMFMQIKAGNTALYIFALAVISVFLALAALYESWSLPLAVILVVPLCLLCSVVGVVWGDRVTALVGLESSARDVNIFVQIGLVVLVGLACKNAILVVEYARQLHHEGRSVYAATLEASRLRLRPIIMTSFAFILGVVPLVFAHGAGAEMRRSLGTAVFSGMIGVTAFGIFLTPVFYYVIQGASEQTAVIEFMRRPWVAGTLGGLIGLGTGYLIGAVEILPMVWALAICPPAGVLAVLAVVGIHRTADSLEASDHTGDRWSRVFVLVVIGGAVGATLGYLANGVDPRPLVSWMREDYVSPMLQKMVVGGVVGSLGLALFIGFIRLTKPRNGNGTDSQRSDLPGGHP
jgi:multidrug efflux pump subunit AcrB